MEMMLAIEDCWPRTDVEEDVVDLLGWFGIRLERGGHNGGGCSRFNVCCIPSKVLFSGGVAGHSVFFPSSPFVALCVHV